MRALLLRKAGTLAPGSLSFEELPDPLPGPGQVLLRLKACGVCRTDLHILEGDLPSRPPLILGHQAVAVVEALGPGCALLKPGDRVGVPWLWSACGSCARCREGLENLCDGARFTGWSVPGGFAQLMLAQEAFAHKLPSTISDASAAPLLCAGAIGWRALKLTALERGRLGLFGFGSSAHLVLQMARTRGLEVYAFSRGEGRRSLALKLGAAWAGSPGDRLPAPLDAAIIFAPAGELVPQALATLGKGGCLVLAGATMSPIPPLSYELLYHERVVRSVANVTRKDVQKTLRAAEKGGIEAEITPFPFEKAEEALAGLKEGRIAGSAVLTF